MPRRRARLFIVLVIPVLLLLYLWQVLLWHNSLRKPVWQLSLQGDIVELSADGNGGFYLLQQVAGQGASYASVALSRIDMNGSALWTIPDISMQSDYSPRLSIRNGSIEITGQMGLTLRYDQQGTELQPESVFFLRNVMGIDGEFAAAGHPDGGTLQFCRLVNDGENSMAAQLGIGTPGYEHYLLHITPDGKPIEAVPCRNPLVGSIWPVGSEKFAIIEYYSDPYLGDFGNSRTVALFSAPANGGLEWADSVDMPGYIFAVSKFRDGLAVLGGDLLLATENGNQTVTSRDPMLALGTDQSGRLLASRESSLPLRGALRQMTYGRGAQEVCLLEDGRLQRLFSFNSSMPHPGKRCLAASDKLVLVGNSYAGQSTITTLHCYRQ